MFIGIMLAGFMWLGAAILAFVLAVQVVWRAVAAPAGLPRRAGCGSCGYELSTLAHGRCSECGADLLMAGVTTRRNAVSSGGSLAGALMGWTLIMIVLTSVVLYIVSIVAMVPTFAAAGGTPYASSYVFQPDPYVVDENGSIVTTPDLRVTADVDVVGTWGTQATSGTISIEIASGGQAVTLSYPDAAVYQWQLIDGGGAVIAEGSGLGAQEVVVGLEAIGLSAESQPDLPEYADEIARLAGDAVGDPLSYEMNYSAGTVRGQPALMQTGGSTNWGANNPFTTTNSLVDLALPLGATGLGVLLWVLGIVFIIRRRRTLLEGSRADASEPSPAEPEAR